MPKISRFSDDIDQLMEDNEDVKVCVRQFDERLSLKAEKTSMTIFR